MTNDVATRTAYATNLHLWHTAANVVATDPIPTRREAYEAAIALVAAQLARYHSMRELVAQAWNIKLWALAATAGLHLSGRVLNYQVVAAAACWQRLCQEVDEASD
jgi:hypothetical protein